MGHTCFLAFCLEPVPCIICYLYKYQHNRHFCKNPCNGSKCSGAFSTDQSNRNGNCQFKKVGGTDHTGRRCYIMWKLYSFACQICNEKDKKSLKFSFLFIIDHTPFQQHSSPLEQPQLGSFPVSQPAITAAAHPTPASTVMTFTGQFFAQAPHSIQLSLSATRALFSLILKTL